MRTTISHSLGQIASTGWTPATVIDVGVAYGTPELYAAFPDARLVLVEALREWEPVLQRLASERKASYVIAAAGAREGTTRITVPSVLAWGSTECLPAGTSPEAVTWREVPMVALDDLHSRLSIQPPCLLKIDVEGGEAAVLAGADQLLCDCEVVVVEVTIDAAYWPVQHSMRSAGFVLHDVVGTALPPI